MKFKHRRYECTLNCIPGTPADGIQFHCRFGSTEPEYVDDCRSSFCPYPLPLVLENIVDLKNGDKYTSKW